MTVYFPAGVDSQGNEAVLFTTALTTPLAPKLTELVATATINISCAIRAFASSADQGSSDDIRLCSTDTYEAPGRVKWSMDDFVYVYDPQAVVPTATNKHFEVMVQGLKGWFIDRRGLNAQSAVFAIGQKVDVYQVTLGPQRRVALDPSADGGKFEITQKAFVTASPIFGATLVA